MAPSQRATRAALRRVLFADSDESQLDRFRRHFNHGFWTLATAVDGMDCIAKLHEFEPDLLVLEPEIPWGGGAGVLECMRGDPRLAQIPVVILTNGPRTDELWSMSGFRLEGFLVKPVTVETLEHRISAIAERLAEERE